MLDLEFEKAKLEVLRKEAHENLKVSEDQCRCAGCEDINTILRSRTYHKFSQPTHKPI